MYIKMPNGYTVFLDNVADYEKRLELVNKLILEYNNGQWRDYFERSWLTEVKIAGKPVNRTKMILDRLATYLLAGQFKDANILTKNKEEKIRESEIPISSTAGSNVSDYVYAVEQDSEDPERMYMTNVSSELSDSNFQKDVYNMSHEELMRLKREVKRQKKRWKGTRTYKLNRLYSTNELKTYKVRHIYYKDENGEKKPLKTIDGTTALGVEFVKIGGRKGIIDIGEPYVAQWCLVDTDNYFEFNGKKFRIDDSVEQYRVTWDEEGSNAEMDMILCYYLPQKDKYYFFDENIDPIDESKIKLIAE